MNFANWISKEMGSLEGKNLTKNFKKLNNFKHFSIIKKITDASKIFFWKIRFFTLFSKKNSLSTTSQNDSFYRIFHWTEFQLVTIPLAKMIKTETYFENNNDPSLTSRRVDTLAYEVFLSKESRNRVKKVNSRCSHIEKSILENVIQRNFNVGFVRISLTEIKRKKTESCNLTNVRAALEV